MSRRDLAAAIGSQPEPPCTGCVFFDMCGINRFACADFWNYANDPITRTPRDVGMPRKPSRLWYDFTFDDPKPGLTNEERRIPLETLARVIAATGTIKDIAKAHGVSAATAHRVRTQAIKEALASADAL